MDKSTSGAGRFLGFGICCFAAICAIAPAQQFTGAISTQGYGDGLAKTWSIKYGPDGLLYSTLGGYFDASDPSKQNHVAVAIDPATHQIVATLTTGYVPRELEFATPPGGQPVGIVVNAADRSVSIFDVASKFTFATASLPTAPGTVPGGLAVNATNTRAYIGGGDAAGTIFVLDLEAKSPTQFQWLGAETLNATSGAVLSLQRNGNDLLASTVGSGAAHAEIVPLPGSSSAPFSAQLGVAPSSLREIALAPDGLAYAVGEGLGGRVYGIDPATGQVARTFPCKTSVGANRGIQISPSGKLAVICDFVAHEISFVDVARGLPLSVINTRTIDGDLYSPRDSVFSPDGTKVFVAMACTEKILCFDLPGEPAPFTAPLGLSLTNTLPAPGELVHITTTGASPSHVVVLLSSFGDDAIDFGPLGILHVTMDSMITIQNTGGNLDVDVVAPPLHGAGGTNFTLQAIAIDFATFDIKLSDELTAIIQ
jgi:DNA-binding beta-propeller fold protein YncE